MAATLSKAEPSASRSEASEGPLLPAGEAAAGFLGPIGIAMAAAGLIKNPWHTALVRADRTGAALATILARTRLDRLILIGHSRGGRVMIGAAEALATSPTAPQIEEMHLLGTARGRKGDWSMLGSAVTGTVNNYHSLSDGVLTYAYTAAMVGSTAVGLAGFQTDIPNITDHNVSTDVAGHTEYFDEMTLL
ncbi:MAG: DUF726 domain-containing protein [Gordonia sp. (in: high G+C Gram-positive bacteria)]